MELLPEIVVIFRQATSGKMVGGGRSQLAIFVLLTIHWTFAHVRLDFPEARDLPLDFLDNVRTPAPCGMPKGQSKTSIEAGTSFNVTWHLSYPHRGEIINFVYLFAVPKEN